jgi:hypothetical protein
MNFSPLCIFCSQSFSLVTLASGFEFQLYIELIIMYIYISLIKCCDVVTMVMLVKLNNLFTFTCIFIFVQEIQIQ